MRIRQLIEKRETELNDMIGKIERFLENAPEGTLSAIDNKGKYCVRYPARKNDSANKPLKKYLKKSEKDLKKMLALKLYYKRLYNSLNNEKKALKYVIKNYKPEEKYAAYSKLPAAIKNMIPPIYEPVEEKIRRWQNERYEEKTTFREGKVYESARGEKMRSKSEVIIANYLDRCPELDYRYEKPLVIPGMDRPIFPDFTIINKKTGKIYYWEHFGMMSDEKYAEEFIRKYGMYQSVGIRPGIDLMMTFESEGKGIDMGIIRKQIRYILEDNKA